MSTPFRRAFVVLLFLAVSSTAQAALLSFKLTGEVTSVDATLTSEFSVSESVEFGFIVDTSTFVDVAGSSTTTDATRFTLTDRYYIFGGDYFGGGGTDTETGRINDDGFYPGHDQGFTHEDHNMVSPDVGGLTKAQIWINFSFLNGTFSGTADPLNIVSAAELLALDDSDIGSHQTSHLSFDAPTYKYVNFDVTGIQVTAVPVPAAAWLFGSGLIGLAGWVRRRQQA